MVLRKLRKSSKIISSLTAVLVLSMLAQVMANEPLRTHPNKAFRPGEVLEYRLHYGFIDAGEARIEVHPKTETYLGRTCYRVTGTGRSIGTFDMFFKVRDKYESVIDSQAIVPWRFIRNVDEGGYKINQNVYFNHFNNTAKSEKSVMNTPEHLQDLISAFYYARTIDFSQIKTGDIVPIQAWLDDEVIPLNVRFIGRQKVKTRLGTFRCIALRPMLQQGRVFKDNEDMTIWVTDDENKIPIRLEAKIMVGSVKMDLKKFSGLINPLALEKK